MKNCPAEYWIWLQSALGAGARTDELLSYFGDPENMYSAGSNEWRLSGLLTPNKIEKLKSTSPSETKQIFDECSKNGYKIITPSDSFFPERLRKLADMPLVLYVYGDSTVLCDELSLGMVGTRNASAYGTQTAQKLSYSLAKAGFTLISGGALGIDSEAHAGAMLAKGRTAAILGCGLSVKYLMENASLRRAIARHGCLVSEYQPMQPASKTTFPIRNRLISGLTLGTVVIEAGKKSGSLITADRALEQGKDLFAVPGDIVRSSFDGTNLLISQGAKPVFSVADILGEYEYRYGELIDFSVCNERLADIEYVDFRNYKKNKNQQTGDVKKTPEANLQHNKICQQKIEKDNFANEIKAIKPTAKKEISGVSKEALAVYSVLTYEETHIDDIVRKSGLSMKEVLPALSELELEGVAEQFSGKHYALSTQ